MIIYTTLKENRANDVDFVNYADECIFPIGEFFGEDYIDDDYTDWDKLHKDFTEAKIRSTVLKGLKKDAKDKENGCMFQYGKFLIDRFFAYEDIKELLDEGLLKKSDLLKIEKQSKAFENFKCESDERDEQGHWHICTFSDLIDDYFPCNEKIVIDEDGFEEYECTHCGNCN